MDFLLGRGEGGKSGRCIGLTTLTPLCSRCQKSWEFKTLGALRAYLGLYGVALPSVSEKFRETFKSGL